MLIRFRVGNYRSFSEDQEISLIAASIKNSNANEISVGAGGHLDVLPSTGIYGANAAGKSNVVSALAYMKNAVLDSQTKWRAERDVYVPTFKLEKKQALKPSYFEIDFIVNSVRYQYGFILEPKRILEEWLYAFPKNRKLKLFTRDAKRDPEFEFGRQLKGSNRSISNLTRPNSLFLSAASQNNHKQLSEIYGWFDDNIRFASEDDRASRIYATSSWLSEQDNMEICTELLKLADLGIKDVKIEKREPRKSDDRYNKLIDAFSSIYEISEEDENPLRNAFEEDPLVVKLMHSGSKGQLVEMNFGEESQGTKELYSLIGPIFWALIEGAVLVIDEVERSLHPILAQSLVALFNHPDTNPNRGQLIFTTHSTNLLSSGVLSRDQIWFVEKDKFGASNLYPLTDFHPREAENLEKGYLQGRYGAVPFLGDFNSISSLA